MKVTVEYHDNHSFLLEEIVKQAKNNYGAKARVSIYPESDTPMDYLYFAIERLVTGDQLTLLYDSKEQYREKLSLLREEMISKMKDVLDDVLIMNESKLG